MCVVLKFLNLKLLFLLKIIMKLNFFICKLYHRFYHSLKVHNYKYTALIEYLYNYKFAFEECFYYRIS